jgi:hypothetical protein
LKGSKVFGKIQKHLKKIKNISNVPKYLKGSIHLKGSVKFIRFQNICKISKHLIGTKYLKGSKPFVRFRNVCVDPNNLKGLSKLESFV